MNHNLTRIQLEHLGDRLPTFSKAFIKTDKWDQGWEEMSTWSHLSGASNIKNKAVALNRIEWNQKHLAANLQIKQKSMKYVSWEFTNNLTGTE